MMNKKVNFIEVLKWILSIAIVIGVGVLGILYHNSEGYSEALCVIGLISLPALLIVGTVVGLVQKKKLMKDLEAEREELQPKLLAQRERASEIAKEKIAEMKKLIRTIDILSACLLLVVCLIAFCFFTLVGVDGAGGGFPFVFGVYVGLYFIRPSRISINENNSEDYLLEQVYPLLYETARRAADTVGCRGKIKIFVDHDFNAGILEISDGYSIRLGSYLLDNMSQAELYNVLLHEFGHVEKKNDERNDIITYAGLMQESKLVGIDVSPYAYFHTKFAFEYFTYQYVCSMMNEDAADAAMREYGEPEVAASMLVKLKFSELYQWERGTYDEENIFESETLIQDCIRRPLGWFKERMEKRQEDWIRMIDSEIISRNASHPTAKMRIANLGVKQARILPRQDSEEYLSEVRLAILHVEEMMHKGLAPSYPRIREENYLEPKRIVDEWENEGRPITKEGYQNIVISLFTLHRIDEFVKLCCQIIDEIPEPANYFAHHMYGIYLLRCYDERGIDHLYKSIELNHNNWEEAMQTIGEYACVVGRQDKLDEYRKRAPELAKKAEDVFEKMNSLNAKDTLTSENLPDGMLSDFLDYVRSIDGGQIERIYMVRKTIDDEHFVTCVVVKPKSKVDAKKWMDVMDKLFQYLDKSSDWQFSLFDIRWIRGINFKRIENSCVYEGLKK